MSASAMLPHDWFPQALPANVTLGDRSWLYSAFAFVHYRSERPSGVRIGQDSGIYMGSFFDLGPAGEVEIGDYCTLVGVIIASNGRVVIEDYAFLAHQVVLADAFDATPTAVPTHVSDDPIPSARPNVFIGANSWIGARAVLLRGASIGEGAIVGAAALVDFAVPPYTIVAGNPGRIVGRADPRERE